MTPEPGRIRAIAICICRSGGRILVFEGYDTVKKETFYRPLGGTIEFGERGEQAVRREFREEIGANLEKLRYLGMLENIFTCDGKRGHEIVLVYDGRLSGDSFYQQESFSGDEMGKPFKVLWVSLDAGERGDVALYPEGLVELIGQG